MKIRIRYPKVKYIEASNVIELKAELKKLMVIDFEVKKREEDGSYSILNDAILTTDIKESMLQLIEKNRGVIFPLEIKRCGIQKFINN